MTDTTVYDPFGDPAASTGSTDPTLGFQADWTDPDTGRVWMGARWYAADWASFLSRDTVFGQLRTPISLNRYTYAKADPLGYYDPDGRFAGLVGFITRAIGLSGSTISHLAEPTSAVREVARTRSVQDARVQSRVSKPPQWDQWDYEQKKDWTAQKGGAEFVQARRDVGKTAADFLADEFFSTETLKDAGKASVNFAAGLVDGAADVVTLGYGPRMGPVFHERHLRFSHSVGRVTGNVVGGVGVGGGVVTATGKISTLGRARGLVSLGRSGRAASVVRGGLTNATLEAVSKDATLGSVAFAGALGGIGGGLATPGAGVEVPSLRARPPTPVSAGAVGDVAPQTTRALPTFEVEAARMPNIARNVSSALEEGHPGILNRTMDSGLISRNRAAACRGFCGAGSPDEYPFASTIQGGAGARVAGVPLQEQFIQGAMLRNFYAKYGIGEGDPFRVIISGLEP